MIDDFNPLDLSVARGKVEEQPAAQPEAPRAKPTVQRVSMGPILHSNVTKIVVLTLALILTGLISYATTSYLLMRSVAKQAQNTTVGVRYAYEVRSSNT